MNSVKHFKQKKSPEVGDRYRGQMLKLAMSMMDRSEGTVVFIFSSLTMAKVKKWRSNSGRTVYQGGRLPLLSDDDALKGLKKVFDGNAAALKLLGKPQMVRERRQMFGHPRWVHESLGVLTASALNICQHEYSYLLSCRFLLQIYLCGL